ncbi:14760_t:CDS:2 [Entrophospora sp. SA101]|nr:14760_t:CDS:2 [Entrophospora sp. SA101]
MIPKNCSVKIQCLETEKKVEASDEIISFGQLTSKQLMKLKMRLSMIQGDRPSAPERVGVPKLDRPLDVSIL